MIYALACLYYGTITTASILVYLHPSLSQSILLRHGKLSTIPGSHPFLAWQVSKNTFIHFYLLGLVLNTLCLLQSPNLLLLLMELHLVRRAYEHAAHINYHSQIHLVHYLLGITYYPVLVLSLAQCCTPPHLLQLAAAILFTAASICQFQIHVELARLRKAGYSPPTSRWFSLVHCPHYLMETLIHFSFLAIPSSFSLPILLNWVWVVVNLSISAWETKAWHARLFGRTDSRGAIIPRLFIAEV